MYKLCRFLQPPVNLFSSARCSHKPLIRPIQRPIAPCFYVMWVRSSYTQTQSWLITHCRLSDMLIQ
jgi:hypothetical protein